MGNAGFFRMIEAGIPLAVIFISATIGVGG
jgi:hypothetical protein